MHDHEATAGRTLLEATLATTHVVEKYGRERLAVSALDDFRKSLLAGGLQTLFNHDPGHPLDIAVVDAEVRALGDGDHALIAIISVADGDWAAVKAAFAEAGVAGGFSYTRREFENVVGPTTMVDAHAPPVITVSADAAAFTADDRAVVALAISAHIGEVVEIRRSYSYADVATAHFLIEASQIVGWAVLSAAIWDGIKHIFPGRKHSVRIEVKRTGEEFSAVIETDSADAARSALEQLARIAEAGASSTAVFDSGTDEWQWPQ